eukprot:TRINITY_DN12157_c0_g1_i4.p1 TRINITY_DN12157_c0_g1~~TRINITY_DN12157_c0_g1_i4.p1  ORF type:complete len:406 (-),score=59.32 TRINITY_DN12157_c0_g1_i4:16-1233(-)
MIESVKNDLEGLNDPAVNPNFKDTKNFLSSYVDKFDSETVKSPVNEEILKIDLFRKDEGKYPFIKILEEEVSLFEDEIADSLKGMQDGVLTLSNDNTFDEAGKGLDTLKEFNDQVRDLKDDIYDYIDKAKPIFKYVQAGLISYYALVLGFDVLMVIGTLFFMLFHASYWKLLSNLGCVLIGILMTLGFLLTTFLFPLSAVLIEGCALIDLRQLKVDRGIVPESAWEQVEVCLAGDGDLYESKRLNESLNFANATIEGLNYMTALYNETERTMRYPIAEELIEDLKDIGENKPYKASRETFPNENIELGEIPHGDIIVWSGCPENDGPINIEEELKKPGSICFPITRYSPTDNYQPIEDRYKSRDPVFTKKLIDHIKYCKEVKLSLIHICRCRRYAVCRSRWSPYH